ncbi:MAG: hypothetical protein MK078_01875 [Crocinitomicaceae bacterium]|nr:hypothetical protein [Crocinitomicaceae bacterium]
MKRFLILIIILSSTASFAQEGSTLFGIQYKPIIPNRIIGTFEQDFSADQLTSSIRQRIGHSYGMMIRHGFTDMFSLEVGLNYNFRKFGLDWAVQDSGYSAVSDVRVVSYEMPVMGLVFIQLGKQFWMDAAIGSSITFFSSDVQVFEPINVGEYFLQEGAYNSKIQGAFLANLGFEYRTKKSGFFHLGASYHLPYAPIMNWAMSYEHTSGQSLSVQTLRGSYLTLDFRYFLPENKDD